VGKPRKEQIMTISTERSRALTHQAGAGQPIRIFDERITVKLDGRATGEPYAVCVIDVAPGGGPPLHRHPGPESFLVLAGAFDASYVEDGTLVSASLGPGAFLHVPGDTPHAWRNTSAARGEMLCTLTPELLTFFEDFGAAFPPGTPSDLERMLAIYARHQVALCFDREQALAQGQQPEAGCAQAHALARRFETGTRALISTIAACTVAQWQAICPDTGWTVAVQAHHIAENMALLATKIRDSARGIPQTPGTTAAIDARNARHAEQYAGVAREDVLALLRRNGAIATETYWGLAEEQLARTATLLVGGTPSSVLQLIQFLAIGEIERHGAAIRAALGGKTAN
jgi:quercetin dioxygenase-like cupin family protein